MKTAIKLWRIGRLLSAMVSIAWTVSAVNAAHIEEKFDVLETKTGTYKNVTVTTHAKNYIFIQHSMGLANIKIEDLSAEIQKQLGYGLPPKPEPSSPTKLMAAIHLPQMKQLGASWQKAIEAKLRGVSATLIYAVLVAAFVLYLFFSYCAMLICKKTGKEPGVLIWVPGLQLFPMLQAAGMSGWWFFGYMIPVLNIVGHILWCFKIVKAREKTTPMAFLLLLPVTSLFAFLYLAFSNGVAAPEKKAEGERPLMSLQTA